MKHQALKNVFAPKIFRPTPLDHVESEWIREVLDLEEKRGDHT